MPEPIEVHKVAIESVSDASGLAQLISAQYVVTYRSTVRAVTEGTTGYIVGKSRTRFVPTRRISPETAVTVPVHWISSPAISNIGKAVNVPSVTPAIAPESLQVEASIRS